MAGEGGSTEQSVVVNSSSATNTSLRITPLGPPGPDSTFLDWEWAVKIHLRRHKLAYVLEQVAIKDRPVTWEDDNITVISIVTQACQDVNFKYLRPHGDNARDAWLSLKAAHQDSTSGGRVYWLYKLVSMRMASDEDVEDHIDRMHKIYEKLDALITPDRPLTADDIYATALVISLPTDWTSCISHLLQSDSTTSNAIVRALKHEAVRRKSKLIGPAEEVSASKSQASKSNINKPKSTSSPDSHCTFCNRDGHVLAECQTADRILKDAKEDYIARRREERETRSKKKNKPKRQSTKAGKTEHTLLGSDSDDASASATSARVCASSTSTSGNKPTDGLLDSGCSISMTPYENVLINSRPSETTIRLADDSTIKSSKKGSQILPLGQGKLHSTLFVPDLHEPLISISGLCDEGMTVVFDKEQCSLYESSRIFPKPTPIGIGERRGNLYYLPMGPNHESASISSSSKTTTSLFDWHLRFNHIGLMPLRKILRSLDIQVNNLNETEVKNCATCRKSKMHRCPFSSRKSHRATEPGQIIHSDVCSFEETGREGYKYFSTFIDDNSTFLAVYPMKSKDQTLSCFKHFRTWFEKNAKHHVRRLRSDNGGEYISKDFESFLHENGIDHDPGPPHSPQLNGVAERVNRVLCERIRALLFQSNVPKVFWVDALRHIIHSINSIPCNTPEGFTEPNSILKLPLINPQHLHPFGCLAWYKVPEASRKKLDPKGRVSILLSYISDGGGFKLWDLDKRVVVKSRDVIFEDFSFPYGRPLKAVNDNPIQVEIDWSPVSQQKQISAPNPTPQDNERRTHIFRSDRRLEASIWNPANRLPPHLIPLPAGEPGPTPPATPPLQRSPSPPVPARSPTPPAATPPAPVPRRPVRTRKQPDRLGNWAKMTSTSEDMDVPKTWKQLLRSPNKLRWLKAAEDELASLIGMSTWKLVPRPAKRKIIKSKWVFKVKRRVDKSILKLKARLVAMGYTQEKGIDFDEVFAPTTRIETLRLVCSLLAAKKWGGYQIDFTTAFLNGKLEEAVYMTQPPGFEDPTHPDWVCEVTGALYGLKQSPRQWNKELHSALLSLGLTQSKFDPTLYFLLKQNKLVCAIAVHVDDLAVIGDEDVIQPLMRQLGSKFKVGSQEPLHHFLSLKIDRDIRGRKVFLSQQHYVEELEERFLGSSHKSVQTPTDSSFKDLHPRKANESESPGPYSSLIGALLWAAQCTRADISFAVNNCLSSYMIRQSIIGKLQSVSLII